MSETCVDDIDIRHYRTSDYIAVLNIAADTAFFGESVEAFLDDRKLYGDAFARYYTEYEAPFAWVADGPDGVIGFLLGCTDTSRQVSQWRRYIISQVLLKAFTGRYKLGRRTSGFAWGMLMGILRGEEPAINVKKYPAHLQIDVKQDYRGMGVGRGLIEAYLEQLRGLAVPGVHLETTNHNEAACYLYEKVGFTLLDERPNHFWTRMFGFQVNNRSYGLTLG
jgi:ribosomal protein S18 acetylase RimI-like enzyme